MATRYVASKTFWRDNNAIFIDYTPVIVQHSVLGEALTIRFEGS